MPDSPLHSCPACATTFRDLKVATTMSCGACGRTITEDDVRAQAEKMISEIRESAAK